MRSPQHFSALLVSALPLLTLCTPLPYAENSAPLVGFSPSYLPSASPSPASPLAPSPALPTSSDDRVMFFPGNTYPPPIPSSSSLPVDAPSLLVTSSLSAATSTISKDGVNTTTTISAASTSTGSSTSSSTLAPAMSSPAIPAPIPSIAPLPSSQPQVMAYYPDWAGAGFPPEKIDFSRFDWIDFAFALPTEQFTLSWDDPLTAPMQLKRLVAAAHAKGKKVKLSIGGWTGAKYFSPAVSNDKNRATFVDSIVQAYNEYNLDGIDIDWEYPGQEGQAGNIISHDDTNNYLLFLGLLRSQLPITARISAATQVVPFADANGQPLKNVAPFAAVLDWILIMNYDVWGSSSNPGPNAPLSDACHNSTQPEANAASAIKSWTDAGFPAHKIVLGVPSYGYISHSSATRLRTRSRHFARLGSNTTDTSPWSLKNDDGGSNNGQVQFRELISHGALVAPSFGGSQGFTRRWDECSSTPYLTSEDAEQVITYDDPQSLLLKASLAKDQGLFGVNMFDVHGDTDEWDLTDAVRKGLGLIP